jgi:hypothetical protein
MPRSEDIQANLAYARSQVSDNLAPPYNEKNPFHTLFFWHQGLNTTELLTVSLGAWMVFWACMLLRLRMENAFLPWLAGVACFVAVMLGGSYTLRTVWPRRSAVVLVQEASVFTSTSSQSPVRFKLHQGAEIKVLEHTSSWVKITLPKGEQGWIPLEHVAVVL